MKCVVDLSEVEEITLQQLSIIHRHRDARTRAAGLLQLGRKVKPKVIAEQGLRYRQCQRASHCFAHVPP
jgi:hypothetical protein